VVAMAGTVETPGTAADAVEEEGMPTTRRLTRKGPNRVGRRSVPTVTGDPMRGRHAERSGAVRRLAPIIALPALLALGCGSSPGLDSAPRRVAGLQLHHEVSGDRALDAVSQFYRDVTYVEGGWTAHYGDDPSLILYVATTGDPAAASALITKTVDRVAAGLTPYRDPSLVSLDAASFYRMTGQEQIHYLFRLGADVVWLSADPEVASAALSDLLGVADAALSAEEPAG
jgi:hypothetical protein